MLFYSCHCYTFHDSNKYCIFTVRFAVNRQQHFTFLVEKDRIPVMLIALRSILKLSTLVTTVYVTGDSCPRGTRCGDICPGGIHLYC